MRYFIRKPNFAAKVFRPAVPSILAAVVCCSPAFAHSHGHMHGRAHRAPMLTKNFSYSSGFTVNGISSPATAGFDATSSMAAAQASAAGIPVSLVERVIRRESGGNARAVHAGNYGLMQIRLSTARAMGYTGSAAGLLDPQTNMTYAVRYLAGAYRAAGGNESRAVALYASGYYYQAKARGFSPYASGARAM